MHREVLTMRPERRVPESLVSLRSLEVGDTGPLADLLYVAYSASPESEGETYEGCREQAASFLNGEYGEPRLTCSFVAFREPGTLLGACLVLLDQRVPLIAYLCTRPEWRRKGIARALLTHTLNTLHLENFPECKVPVGVENTAAQALLRQIGFHGPNENPDHF